MRVLLLFPHFNTLGQASSLRSWQLGRILSQSGHNVTVYAPAVDLRNEERFEETKGTLYREMMVDGVRLVRVFTLERFRSSPLMRFVFEAIYAVMCGLRALFEPKPDVVVGAYPPAFIPPIGLGVARLKGAPFVFEMRDLMADNLEVTGYVNNSLVVEAARFLERFVIKRCDHLIAVTPGIAAAALEKGADEDKLTVNSNGYEPEVFAEANMDWSPEERFGWMDRFVVVYAGGLTQSYDIPTLLRAAGHLRDLNDIRFAIVGEGDRKEDYIEYCRDNGLENCQFIDYQPRRDMPNILSSADLGVHLFEDHEHWGHVLGNKTFDYLGSGLPMVYAGVGDTADLIRESGGGIVVTPEADDELAEVIEYLYRNKDICRQMGKRGREYVQSEYNRHKLGKAFERTLRTVAAD